MSINHQTFEVTEKHKRLVICLLNGITQKNDIINIVWYEQGGMVSDNNYHQLIHKFRNLLSDNQLPKAMLRTIPRHGAILDLSLLATDNKAIPDDGPVSKMQHAKKTFRLTTVFNGLITSITLFTKSLYR
ncbi:MAG: hypothetical protein P4L95_06990 [Rouxiella aceris]|uniref:winged helix-turn-helix domain-containing protein n=1 Tax=Rouxiella aceris TaxID=2703884 RepID=UPI002842D3D2|nr:hypothetical protein [Rouxiella aceris]MDR3431639.1 hypothetical protein [Rouxiella aceris]